MIMNGRQYAETLDGIRDDHKVRYRAAGAYFESVRARRVIDIGCGCGYGAFILASEFGLDVVAVDIDVEALKFAQHYYSHVKVTHLYGRARHAAEFGEFSGIVALEVIEHVAETPALLAGFREIAPRLFGSVPNQLVVPFDRKRHPAHLRHFTPTEIEKDLNGSGWLVRFLGGQRGKHGPESAITSNASKAATLIFAAEG